LLVTFKDKIEFDEPRSLEEAIRKLNGCYDKSKDMFESKQDWKGNENTKGNWDKKRGGLQDTGNKENVVSHKKFNTTKKGQGF